MYFITLLGGKLQIPKKKAPTVVIVMLTFVGLRGYGLLL